MKYIILFFLLLPTFLFSQVTVQLFEETSIEQNIVDTSFIECKYDYKWVKDTLSKGENLIIDEDIMVLLIGEQYTKMYSYKSFLKDSMVYVAGLQEAMENLKNYKGGSEEIVLKNRKENELTYIDKIGKDYFSYQEQIPDLVWEIKSDTLEILGYNCIKAVCDFRGRRFIAWFTPDIPIDAGPWKFNSLPGLIMRVYDTQEHYVFNIVGIRNVAKQISTPDRKFIKTNRKKYLAVKRNMLEDPIGYLQTYSGVKVTVTGKDGKPMDAKDTIKKMKYGFIEIL